MLLRVKRQDLHSSSLSIKKLQVLQKRLYLEAVESVLSNSSKVMIDVEGGNNMMYLPLDQLINRNQTRASGNESDDTTNESSSIMDQISETKNNFNLRKRDLYNE